MAHINRELSDDISHRLCWGSGFARDRRETFFGPNPSRCANFGQQEPFFFSYTFSYTHFTTTKRFFVPFPQMHAPNYFLHFFPRRERVCAFSSLNCPYEEVTLCVTMFTGRLTGYIWQSPFGF